jgi:putative endonuclease
VRKQKLKKMNIDYYVSIPECHDGSYYTGITNDLNRRMKEHQTGFDPGCYTYMRRPVELKYFEPFQNVNEAISWEKQIKGWSRKKKQALFESNWERLKELAKSKNNKN